MKGLSKVVLCG
jgi:hypothetical protein